MNKRQIIEVGIFLVLLISIPVTMYLVKTRQVLKSRADFQNSFTLTDASGHPLAPFSNGYQTTTSTVIINVTSIQFSPSPVASVAPSSSPEVSPTPVASASPVASPSSSPQASASPVSSASPVPSESPVPNPSPSVSPVASASPALNSFIVSLDPNFSTDPAAQTTSGTLDTSGNALANFTNLTAGLHTIYVKFPDKSTPYVLNVNYTPAGLSSPTPSSSVGS